MHHPEGSPCREAYLHWCCNPNGKAGTSGRLSWDPIAVMIASLDVGSVFEKEVNYGTQVTADEDGAEHFFGSGTKNAQTDFVDPSASPGEIPGAIDGFLNRVPGQQPGWRLLGGKNCYGARGTSTSHGAKDLETPASAAAGPPMSMPACQAKCDALPGCTAVTTRAHSPGLVDCYRKADVIPQQCDQGTDFDTYLRPS